jgi:hypothetical protein
LPPFSSSALAPRSAQALAISRPVALPGRHRDRVVPRRQHRHDAARLGDHEIGRGPAAVQTATAVQRPEFGVLHKRAGPGLHAAEGVRPQLARLLFVELGEFIGRGADGRGCCGHGGSPLGGRRSGPVSRGRAGPCDGVVTGRGVGNGHPGDGVTRAGIENG